MSFIEVIILIIVLAMIMSGVLLLKQSATKFNLTDEQLKKIKERNQALEKEAEQEEQD